MPNTNTLFNQFMVAVAAADNAGQGWQVAYDDYYEKFWVLDETDPGSGYHIVYISTGQVDVDKELQMINTFKAMYCPEEEEE